MLSIGKFAAHHLIVSSSRSPESVSQNYTGDKIGTISVVYPHKFPNGLEAVLGNGKPTTLQLSITYRRSDMLVLDYRA